MMFKNVLSRIDKTIHYNKKTAEVILVSITVLMCLVYAYKINHNVNFVPINGTFQDFNPVRRLLDGQTPVKEFVDYLGLGHLFIGGIFTYIFGGNYYASLVAYDFARMLIGSLLFYEIAVTITKDRLLSLSVLTGFLVFVFALSPVLTSVLVFKYLLKGGASARYIRAGILPICCLIIRFVYTKISDPIHRSIALGIMAGISFLWSNDVGISCFVCIFVHSVIMMFINKQKIGESVICFLIELFISVVVAFVACSIFTGGNFALWISKTFGIGGFQSWYYNSDKSLYIYDIDLTVTSLIMCTLAFVYLIKTYTHRSETNKTGKYITLLFLTMACFCSINEYKLLSGEHSTEVSQYVIVVIFLMEIVSYISQHMLNKCEINLSLLVVTTAVPVSLIWMMVSGIGEIRYQITFKQSPYYVEQLGGELTKFNSDIKEASEFLDGKKIFSMYASAQEVVEDQFQPTGTDYIIHVLGDDNRAEYLDVFKTGDFDYVTTIKEEYTSWEPWVVRANWFVYRNLLENYHPVYANSYEHYWTKNNKCSYIYSGKIDTEVIKNSDNSYTILISTSESVDGYADVYISYDSELTDGASSLLTFKRMILLENEVENYDNEYTNTNYLRASGEEYTTVRVINGKGELHVTSLPDKNTTLSIIKVSCNRILTVEYDFVEIEEFYLEKENVVIVVDGNSKNINKLQDKNTVILNNEFEIKKIKMQDDKILLYIEETVFEPLNSFNGNMLEVK